MLALLTAEAVVVGALDLLIVILAIGVLGRPQAWAGYLSFACGVGSVLAATVSAVLVGRRLGAPIVGAALVLSGALAALALGLGVAGTVALLMLAGASHTLLEIATRTLLQRSVPPRLLGRVFGLLEGFMMAGYALGALLVPLLVHLGGSRVAVLGVAAVLPLAAVAGGRALFGLDAGARVPGGGDRAAALAAIVRRAARTGERGPRGGCQAGPPGRGHRVDPAGRAGRCLLCDRRGGNSTSGRMGVSCAAAGAAKGSARSPCCVPSRARRP
jgi:MFS family permease